MHLGNGSLSSASRCQSAHSFFFSPPLGLLGTQENWYQTAERRARETSDPISVSSYIRRRVNRYRTAAFALQLARTLECSAKLQPATSRLVGNSRSRTIRFRISSRTRSKLTRCRLQWPP